jgi:TRAP-type C4-dicarboxylate transport system substrate-binding protein
MGMPDTYLSMDKGVIDGMDVSWEATYSFRLYEIVKFYTFVPLSSTNFSMVMNKQKWESLPKDIQAAITSVSGLEAAKFWGRNWYDTVQNAVLEQIKRQNGGERWAPRLSGRTGSRRWRVKDGLKRNRFSMRPWR